MLGDAGLLRRPEQWIDPDDLWVHLLAERCGAEWITFALAGGRMCPSRLAHPPEYMVTRVVLEADVVISIANPRPHLYLVWNGAIKNMFNAVIGAGNAQLYKLLPTCDGISAAIADVCRLARPTITIADMIDVSPGWKRDLWRIGLIAASSDPVALDSALVQSIGWDPTQVPSILWGKRLGVGEWERRHVELRGTCWSEFPIYRAPFPTMIRGTGESILQRSWRVFNHTKLNPRPVIDAERCTSCTRCVAFCPVQAISTSPQGTPKIQYSLCRDCEICVSACPEYAISVKHRGLAACLYGPMRATRRLWRWAKVEHVWSLGGIAVRWNVERKKNRARHVSSGR